uniref:Ubiquitin carboxyl-terminal hydrolase 26 n=1 Tax=Kalanchoe fedtschenkoi TaxID=63787 RepID=A0A7N0U7K5_KALFE
MSRPATRGKNKKRKDIDDGSTTAEILRKIHSTGEVTSDDISKLYMIEKPVCQGCRVNTRDNPNCFCGLVPPPNGSRKSGLWQKMSEILSALGPDPNTDLRTSPYVPAGLTNLGATCYANSILQFLYMNKSFREGVFVVEPDVLNQDPVLNQLARLFAQLHASKMSFIDSAPFIKTLELDNGVQQDSHEFLTLLLSLLERCLSCSRTPKARTVVQDLFRGSVSHVTTCSKCGKDSEASSNMEDFYELELNIKGLKGLDDSLNDYLSIEALCGDNQYFCDSCGIRVDAARSIKLRTLPKVLNFQLKRCVFVPKTTTKKKITSPFSFPGVLDMGQRMYEPSQSALIYDLSAVLIHKGTAVNSGHYTAHIKDHNAGRWWEFDDEQVSDLGYHPFGEGSSSPATKDVKKDLSSKSTHEPETNGVKDNGTSPNLQHGSVNGAVSDTDIFSSTDAYMLMYKLRCDKVIGENQTSESRTSDMEIDGESKNPLEELPPHLREEMRIFNDTFLDTCQHYLSKRDRELKFITERRQEVRSVLSEAPVTSTGQTYFWISSDWLRQWADNIYPDALDNTSIVCNHKKVPASKVCSMKRLTSQAWTNLYSKYNGGPVLSADDYCIDCLIDGAQNAVTADSYRGRRATMKELALNAIAGKCDVDGLYYVSKTWLQQWLRRTSPCDADAGPTAAIRCPHGELLPELASGAKRVLVPERLWSFFYECANALKPDDTLGCSTFRSESEPCALCSVELSEVACLEDARREVKLKQRHNHEKLATSKSTHLLPDCRYYLVPSSWLKTWKNFVNASGKSSNSVVEPEALDGAIDLLKCEKHGRLIERPPDLICKRGLIFQKDSGTEGLTIITEDDWRLFCEEWGGAEEKGLSAVIEIFRCGETKCPGTCKDKEPSGEKTTSHDEVNGESEPVRPLIKTYPEVCEVCIGERESCELMHKLNYCDEDITVSLVRGKEPPKSVLEASGSNSGPDRRTSKRSRRTAYGNTVNLKVSGNTSIYQLKMMIWESFGVVKENQILHKNNKVIDAEIATLADLSIFPGDQLWVRDSEIHENRDIADELADQKMDAQQAEEGFRGTLLTSNLPSQVV